MGGGILLFQYPEIQLPISDQYYMHIMHIMRIMRVSRNLKEDNEVKSNLAASIMSKPDSSDHGSLHFDVLNRSV